MNKSILLFTLPILLISGGHNLASTIDPERPLSWSPSLGWVVWDSSPENGAAIGEYVCSGFLWMPNAGWANLGSGEPANGIHYANDTEGDYGVNHDENGALRGLAWSPTIGWVVFEEQGDPRVDLRTGELSGAAWMPNAGWIDLGDGGEGNVGARITHIAAGRDSDGDGIPDAWKRQYAGDIESLPGDGDASGNGVTNYKSYLAGLDPFDPAARFQIVEQRLIGKTSGLRQELAWTSRPNRVYRLWQSTDLQEWELLGPSPILSMAGEVTRFEVSDGGDEESRVSFFRVEALLPLRQAP